MNASTAPPPSTGTTARGRATVVVREVSKGFSLPHQRYSTLKERVLHPMAPSRHEVLPALHDVSFEVADGEFFGIVGRNGSGKSTLLKCLAGIYSLDRGTIELSGQVSPFIELGVGFNPDLTARDNVLINAIMLGLSRKEARRRFDSIIAFAELEDFLDLKLKNYSSGMAVRLGFAVAVQVDAEILLIDEVLAVGDASFQRKCFEEFERLRAEGRTILFVTHDMNTVERFCDRAMLIEKGRLIDIGAPDEIARHYNEVNFGRPTMDGESLGEAADQPVRVLTAWCEGLDGERVYASRQGEKSVVCVELEFLRDARDPLCSVQFRNEVRHTIFVATNASRSPLGSFRAGERAVIRFRFENWLAPARYTLTPAVGLWDGDYVPSDQREDIAALLVEADRHTGGATDLPTEVEVERR